ncbi:hypothetical protein ACET3Z_024536 [Daucus carota]
MLSFLRCVLCCDDEINTGQSESELYYDESPSQPFNYRVIPDNYDTFSRTQIAKTTRTHDICTTYRFPPKSNPPPVYNPPKQTLSRITDKVISESKKPPTATDTNVFLRPASSSSRVVLPPQPSLISPSLSKKPILAPAPSSSTLNQAKSQYNVVEQGSTPLFVIPEDIKGLIRKDIVPGVLKKPLSPQTYKDYFAALLYAEDYYLEKWDGFEMTNVTLKLNEAEIHRRKGKSKNKNNDQKDEKIFVEFQVDSIPERRPYLLSRDFASVRPTGTKVDPFQGIIFRVVRSNIVLVEFGEDFHAQHYSSCKYDVKFSFNRVCLKRAHQAIAAVSDMFFRKFLFPDCRPEKVLLKGKILFSRHKLDSSAISRIINLSAPPAYLLEGPISVTRDKQLSRTGMVIRDAVVQLCQVSSHNRILICAPTNSTCDVFMRSLRKEVGDSNIFRANAAFRELDGVPIDILPFCPYKEKEEVFSCPSLSQLRKFKVILSTFMSSFRLHNEGIEGGHFTHIFLVDASSAIEPEVLVPLTNLTNASTNVVITGAPENQSGWVRSTIARQNGLKTSYFERLRQSKLYRDLNPESITQISDNSSSSLSYFSAQNAPTTQRQTLPPPVYNQPKDTLPRVTLKVDSGINTRKTPYAPIETHSALPGSAKSPAVLNKPVLCHAAPGSTSHLTKSTYNIVEEGSTPLYEIPEDIKTLIKRDIVPPILKKPLSAQTYKDYFAALLYAEDYYLEKWDGFETKDVTLRLHEAEIFERKGKYKHSSNVKKDDKVFVEFEMNAIPEKLPFLLSRDFASVRPSGRNVDPFQGIIFRVVKSNIVLVEFGDDFHAQHYSSCKYDVKFSFNRVCLKRAHQSIASASDMLFKKFLFPNCHPKYLSHYSTAITRIINITDSHPYLLEGSLSINRNNQLSGTGTLVRDTVVQLCQASSLNRVLICAPLNSTCDVFMRSLQREFSDSEIFRANAAFREVDGVPDDILPFCPYKQKEEVFTCPSLPQLLKFKVILSTFMSSFRLHSNGIEGGHFTHVILVDASSATEPEIMVPLTNLTSVSTKVLVTGSPGNQSRWVRSDIARHNGLMTSYFERLRRSNFYRDLNPEFITQLEDDSRFPATSYFR